MPRSSAGSPPGPRYHIHFTPTYSSWLNQVEIWFNIITQKAIRRGSFSSVAQLKEKILRFTDNYNPGAHPFLWTATADSILQKIQRTMYSYLWDTTVRPAAGHGRSTVYARSAPLAPPSAPPFRGRVGRT